MISVSLIFAIHIRGKNEPKNNQFHQVVSTEKGTFADSKNWLDKALNDEVSRWPSGATPAYQQAAMKSEQKAGTKQTFSNT